MHEIVALRLIHVLAGTFWVGSGLFTAFFLLPVLKESGPAAAQVMLGLQRRHMFSWLPISALLTMLSGARLMMIASNTFSSDYFRTPSGMTYAVSGVLAVVAFTLSLVVSRPGSAKVSNLSSIAVSDEINRDRIRAEIAALQKRVAMSSSLAIMLLILAAAGMAIARYL
jgi:uncharacterized membrane protein